MSMLGDTLKFFQGDSVYNGEIQILLVCTTHSLLELMKEEIQREKHSRKIKYELKIHITDSISELLQSSSPQICLDFIVFLLETRAIGSINQVEKNLKLIENRFSHSRICVVKSLKTYEESLDIWNLTKTYHFHNLFGNLDKDETRRQTAGKILNLVELNCGVNTGIPYIGTV